jgi:UDP-glucuronate 4-epimerase
MAPYKFARAIARGETIEIFNYGRMQRDFTYIDDIVEGVVRLAGQTPDGYRLFNIGSSAPIELMEFVRALENAFGRRARKRFRPLEPGDVVRTHADVSALERATGFRPSTPLEVGVAKFAEWYRDYHREELYEHGTSHAGDSRRLAAVFRAS